MTRPEYCNELLHEMIAKVLSNAVAAHPEITGIISSEFVRQLEILVARRMGQYFDPPMHTAKFFLPVVPNGAVRRALLRIAQAPNIALCVWEVTKSQPRIL